MPQPILFKLREQPVPAKGFGPIIPHQVVQTPVVASSSGVAVTFNSAALSPYGQLLNGSQTLQAKSTSGTTRAESRATVQAQATQCQFEMTVSALATAGGGTFMVGVDDGTWDMTVDDSSVPGLFGEGVCLQLLTGGYEIDENAGFVSAPVTPTLSVNDTISCVIDKTAGTVTFYLMRGGSQISNFGGAISWTPPTGSNWFAWAAASGAGLTIDSNFGSGQIRTLDSGFAYYNGAGTGVAAPDNGGVSANEADDSASVSGTVTVAGTGAATEAADTASASGALTVTGSGAATEASENAAATGAVSVTGAISSTEAADTASIAASAPVAASGAITEANDNASAAGTLTVSGSGTLVEANDNCSASGTVGAAGSVTGSAAIVEADDTATAAAFTTIAGSAAANDNGDTCATFGSLGFRWVDLVPSEVGWNELTASSGKWT